MASEEIPVLLNADAVRDREATTRSLSDTLLASGLNARIVPLSSGQLRRHIESMVCDALPLVAVAGGDGTISLAAACLLGSETALAPVPLGTLNHFARRLGIESIEHAARAIAARCVSSVSAGMVNDQVFVNCAVCGHYPRLIRLREDWRRWLGKWPAAALAGLRVLQQNRLIDVLLEVNDELLRRVSAAIWVGVGRGSFSLPGNERLRDARVLEVVVPHSRTRLGLLSLATRVAWRLWRSERARTAGLEILHTASLRLEAKQSIDVALDGEVRRLNTPLQFGIHPSVLRVVLGVDVDQRQMRRESAASSRV